jgi:hypothetical protein
MTSYQVHLTAAQRKRLLEGQLIRIPHKHLSGGAVPLYVDATQFQRLLSAQSQNKGAALRFSPDQAEYHITHGGGFWSGLKNIGKKALGTAAMNWRHTKILKKMNEMPRVIKDYLSKYGDQSIVSIQLGRKPVSGGVTFILNALSNGQLEQARKDLKYDEIYHSFLLVKLRDGKEIRLEKNERVAISETIRSEDRRDTYNIPITKSLTLRALIENAARAEGEALWRYTPARQNCQAFVFALIKHSHLTPSDPRTLAALTPQNGEKLISSLGSKAGVVQLLTDLGGYTNVILNGGRV